MTKVVFYDSDPKTQTLIKNSIATNQADIAPEFIFESISDQNIISDAEVISVFVSSQVTKEVLQKMPNLKLIVCRSTGVNNVDLSAAKAQNIQVTNIPTYGEHTVAEYTFGLLIALLRKLPQAMNVKKFGEKQSMQPTGNELFNKTIGIIGAGKIGQNVAKIAQSFGMKVLAYDPLPNQETAKNIGFEYVELNDLLAKSDIVSIHATYLGSNRHIISDVEFAKMRPSTVLINTARGELVDSLALVKALDNQRIAGAALDTIENEDLVTSENLYDVLENEDNTNILKQTLAIEVLRSRDDTIITQHNAFNSFEALQRISDTTIKNITQFLSGNPVNLVEQAEGASQPGKLIISRHAESEWNALGKWTGTTDVHLTPKGFHESKLLGEALKNTKIDFAYCSEQIRTLETLEGILDASQQITVPYRRHGAINERDYGDLTGKNKWEVKEEIGEEAFNGIRRGWDYPVPNGETLKMVYERVIPFYENEVLPRIKRGQNVLLVAHGNSIRALVKYVEDISDVDVSDVEMLFGQILVYNVDSNGKMAQKEVLTIDTTPPKA